MATPLENARFAQTLFDPLRQSFSRNLDARLGLAQDERNQRLQAIRQNLLRAQALEDQAAEARLRTTLQEAQNTAAAERNRDSLTFQDQKLTASEKAAARERVAEAYTQYKQLGGTDSLTKFGDKDSLETYYAIQDAIAPLQLEAQKKQGEAAANVLSGMRDELDAMANLSDAEISEEIGNAIATAATNPEYEKPLKALNKLIGDNPDIKSLSTALAQVGQQYPAFATTMAASLRGQINARRMEKVNSPEYTNLARRLNDTQEGFIRTIKDPFVATQLLVNMNTRSQPAGGDGGGMKSLIDPTKIKTDAAAGNETEGNVNKGGGTPISNLRNVYGTEGLAGIAKSIGPSAAPWLGSQAITVPDITGAQRWAANNLRYIPGTLAQIAGGEKLVSDLGLDQVDVLRSQRSSPLADLREIDPTVRRALLTNLLTNPRLP